MPWLQMPPRSNSPVASRRTICMSRMGCFAQVIKACKARAAQEALVAMEGQLVHQQPELCVGLQKGT